MPFDLLYELTPIRRAEGKAGGAFTRGCCNLEGGAMEEKLYMNAKEAARYAGLSERLVFEMLGGDNPPPHLKVGNKRLIQRATWPAYLESLQEVRL